MENRSVVRHDAAFLQESLTRVTVVLPNNHEIESSIIDISSQGVRVLIPPSTLSVSIPVNNETVGIVFKDFKLHLTCRCIFSLFNHDGSIIMGCFAFDPDEQNKLRELIG